MSPLLPPGWCHELQWTSAHETSAKLKFVVLQQKSHTGRPEARDTTFDIMAYGQIVHETVDVWRFPWLSTAWAEWQLLLWRGHTPSSCSQLPVRCGCPFH